MGRLAGFRYREITKRLKKFGFQFGRRLLVAMRFGTILKRTFTQQYRTTEAHYPKGLCGQY